MPLLTAPLRTDLTGTNVLQPVQNPQDARWNAGSFGPSQTLYAGTVLGKLTSTGLLYAYSAANTSGLGTAVGLLMYTIATSAVQPSAGANVHLGSDSNDAVTNPPLNSAPYFTTGDFDTTELAGWDTTARTNLGATVLGANSNWVHIP